MDKNYRIERDENGDFWIIYIDLEGNDYDSQGPYESEEEAKALIEKDDQ